MPGRIDTNAVDVLNSILARLRAQITIGGDPLTERQCYAVARPDVVTSIPPGGDFFLTVAMGGGTFNDVEQIEYNCQEQTEFTVSIYSRIKTDSTGHDGNLLTNATRGLLAIKRDVLKALVGHDLVDTNGFNFLRDLLAATRSDPPDVVKATNGDIPCGVLRITFKLNFDWDLTT